jgi:hypothetical protein
VPKRFVLIFLLRFILVVVDLTEKAVRFIALFCDSVR